MSTKIERTIEIPKGVEVTLKSNFIEVKGPKGETKKRLAEPSVSVKREGNVIILNADKNSKKEKRIINTFVAHIKNLMHGVTEGYEYTLKICSGHFPMTVTTDQKNIVVKNFLGEKVERIAKIALHTKVDIKGDVIVVSGVNKEEVGQTASNIEQSTRITNRDRRIFMDGLWITSKAGRKME